MKVLLVCHALAPGRGSEPGFGWNWAWHLSKYHEIWVLAHPEYRAEVDAYLAAHPNPRLHVVWLKATDWDPTKGMGGFTWHYFRWLNQAEHVGRSLHAEASFGLVHHISLSTISAPPTWWKLGIPFVWGPLGGAQTCPPALRELFEGQRWREWLRPIRLRLLRHYPPFRAAVRNSAAVLATNRETVQYLESMGVPNVPLFLDSGVLDDGLPDPPARSAQPDVVRILWASGFQKRKALPLALEALALSPGTVRLKLAIAGDGDERRSWMAMAVSLGLGDRVEFLGKLPPEQMRQEFRQADVFLFTSVRDSCANVVLEAMSHGLPVVTLDLHGVGAYLPDDAGIKVPVGPRASVVRNLSDALLRLARDYDLRHAMGNEAWRFASTQLWSKRADQMNILYQQVTASPAHEAVSKQAEPGTILELTRPVSAMPSELPVDRNQSPGYGEILPAGGDTATPLNLEKRLRIIERYSLIRNRRILDCGCGAGDYVLTLRRRDAEAWGVEFSREKLATSIPEVRTRLSVGDLHDIAFQNDSMDVALLNEVLEHVPDDRRALSEVYRVLRPGGTLLIFSPNRRYPFETHGAVLKRSRRRVPHYLPLLPYVPLKLSMAAIDFWARNYWPSELRRLVSGAGFRITHTDYVWQTFEGISGHQPWIITRSRGALRNLSNLLERVPIVRTLGVSQVIVATKPTAPGHQ